MHVHALFFVSNLGACLDIHSSLLDWLFIGINYYNKYLNCEKLRFIEFNGWISILYSKHDNCFESLNFFLISETKFMILEYLANNWNKSKSMFMGVYFVENFSYERCLLSNTSDPLPKKKWLVRLKH